MLTGKPTEPKKLQTSNTTGPQDTTGHNRTQHSSPKPDTTNSTTGSPKQKTQALQVYTGIHKATQGYTRLHKATQSNTKAHKANYTQPSANNRLHTGNNTKHSGHTKKKRQQIIQQYPAYFKQWPLISTFAISLHTNQHF